MEAGTQLPSRVGRVGLRLDRGPRKPPRFGNVAGCRFAIGEERNMKASPLQHDTGFPHFTAVIAKPPRTF